jgi:hypothetical protein
MNVFFSLLFTLNTINSANASLYISHFIGISKASRGQCATWQGHSAEGSGGRASYETFLAGHFNSRATYITYRRPAPPYDFSSWGLEVLQLSGAQLFPSPFMLGMR